MVAKRDVLTCPSKKICTQYMLLNFSTNSMVNRLMQFCDLYGTFIRKWVRNFDDGPKNHTFLIIIVSLRDVKIHKANLNHLPRPDLSFVMKQSAIKSRSI